MALKDVDFKQFFLARGERVALAVAGVLTALLIVLFLFRPGHGFFAKGPDDTTKEIGRETTSVTSRLNSSAPLDKVRDAAELPPDAAKLDKFDTAKLDGSTFAMAELTPPGVGGAVGRKRPFVYKVEELAALPYRAQLSAYIFDLTGPRPQIMHLRDPDGTTKGNAGGIAAMFGPKGTRKMPGGPGGMSIPNVVGARGGKGRPGMGMPVMGDAEGSKKQDMKATWIDLAKVKESDHLAKQPQPSRQVIVAATFPYKKQLEEFKSKLGLATLPDVINEKSQVKLKDGTYLPSLRFLEVVAQRQELDGDDKPVPVRGADGKLVEWRTLNLKADYRPYVFVTGLQTEKEDEKYAPVIFEGLVMPRLKLFRAEDFGAKTGDKEAPTKADRESVREYPKVEDDLETLKKTLKALETNTAVIAKPKSTFDPDGLPIFGGAPKEESGEEKKKEEGKEEATGTEVPEYVLVRVIDVTVQPGKAYRYRLQVRMANPNYKLLANRGEKGVADLRYAKEPVLESEWSAPVEASIDRELRYYAVDESELAPPTKGGRPKDAVRPGQLIMQAHRWIETMLTNTGAPLYLGEWSVAERFPVYRGEYVGRKVKVELPAWRYTREEFVLTVEAASGKKGKQQPGIGVDFGYGRLGTSQPEAILVDFDPGKGHAHVRGTDKKAPTVADHAAPEALLLSPDGELLLLEGARDAKDAKRVERVEKVRDRISEVKDGDKKGGPGKKGKPFG